MRNAGLPVSEVLQPHTIDLIHGKDSDVRRLRLWGESAAFFRARLPVRGRPGSPLSNGLSTNAQASTEKTESSQGSERPTSGLSYLKMENRAKTQIPASVWDTGGNSGRDGVNEVRRLEVTFWDGGSPKTLV